MPKVLQQLLQWCKNYTKRPGGLRGAIKIKVPDRKLLNSKKGMNCPTPKSLVPIRFLSVVSWHVMPVLSRCVVLCQFVFGYVRRCSVVSCCAVLYRALLYNVMGSCVALCYVRLCSSLLCCKKSWVRVCLCAGGPQVFVHFLWSERRPGQTLIHKRFCEMAGFDILRHEELLAQSHVDLKRIA